MNVRTYFARLLPGRLGKVGAGAAVMLALSLPANALVITPIFDASWTNATTGAPALATTAVESVISEFESIFSNPVTITVDFSWGGELSGAGTGFVLFPSYTFAQTETLFQHAALLQPSNQVLATAVAHLPSALAAPNGSSTFRLPYTEYSALTETTLSIPGVSTPYAEAYVDFAANFCGETNPICAYDYSGSIPGADQVDFFSVAEHEIAHAMGRVDYANLAPPGYAMGPPFLTPLDFYKYDCGTTTLDPTEMATCFSYDGGATDPMAGTAGIFNPIGDTADWQNTANCGGSDSFDACINVGIQETMSSVDIQEMCALGWTATACASTVPEPSSIALLGASLFGIRLLRRRHHGSARPIPTLPWLHAERSR
jgi:hypothetical protein